ncbi:HlyD family secretion protein [Rhodopseudomonas boonkerdii]|uniref:HlyD family secretion protein n=1 Tax=Rhodopseudomonas boonkerdii TaxID=475937 RepID=UPI001E5F4329
MIATDNAYVRADIVTIAPRISGIMAIVEVRDNQQVYSGDVLARIDDRDYRARLRQADGSVTTAHAGVTSQQAHIANLDAKLTQQQSTIAERTAAVAVREAEAQLAELDYQRQLYLSGQQASSIQRLQSAEADQRKATASLTEARASLSTAKAALAVLGTERDAARADLDSRRGALEQALGARDIARLDLERTAIRSPANGWVGQRAVREGQYAETGMPLMAIVPGDIYVIANYKETQIDRIRPGQPASVIVDALGGISLTGHVDSMAPASGAQFALLPPDNATGNFTKIVQRMPLRIRIDADQARTSELRPGMSVEATVDTREPAR